MSRAGRRMDDPMEYAAVMFDLDGTLLDTIKDIADSMNAVLERRGLPGHPAERYKSFVGDGVETLVRRALPADRRHHRVLAECVEEVVREYAARWDRKTRPYPGVPEMLDALEARGFKLAVLSNKPEEATRLCVERFFGGNRFQAVRGARPGLPRKPDPAGALEIAADLDVEPARWLYLGDTDTDMLTARRAGMVPVGAAWGFRGERELAESGARWIVSHPRELLSVPAGGGPGTGA